MKRVNFNTIKIKNFLSIGNDPVVLDFKPGVHIITGINRDKVDRRNAVGKTSVVESIYFAVFGNTLRDIKKDLIPNSHTNGTCEVVLDFDVEEGSNRDSYKITRTLNPSKLALTKNGKDVTRDSIKNTEEDIHNILSASPSVFENCVIMTLNNATPFMAKSKVDKRKFIEGIFNLGVFSQMLSEVREQYSEKKRVHEIILTKYEEISNNLNTLNTQRTNVISSRSTKAQKYIDRKNSNLEERATLEAELGVDLTPEIAETESTLTKLQQALEDYDNKADKQKEKKYTISSAIAQFERNRDQIGTKKDKCPTCLKTVTDHDKECITVEKQKIETTINDLNKQLTTTTSKISKLLEDKNKVQLAIKKVQQKINELSIRENKKSSIQSRIEQLNAWLEQLDSDIDALKSDKTDFDVIISEVEEKQLNAKEELHKHKSQLNLLDTVKYIVSEEGVKSYIVNKILELFNNMLAHYLRKMDANCLCFFDEYFEEEIINEKKKVCSYFNFSGAERKNIDFACLFTFMDMRRLQGDVTYNISIYDELFDSSLDEKGVDLVTSILKERVETHGECVMVISHRKESVKHATGETIFLEKKNGITRRLDYNPFTDT